jgi:phosphoglycolate phosphatase
MSRPRLIIFDVDGTLVDSQRIIVATAQAAFRSRGLEAPTGDDILSGVGLSLPHFMARLAPGEAADDLAEAYRRAYRAQIRDGALSPLYRDVRDVLDKLAADPFLTLGIATGKSRRGLDHLLAGHDLQSHFVTVQVADDHPSKPHPSMLLAALAETGTDPADAVMVGDTTYDMDMARAAGLIGIGVSWGYHAQSDLTSAHHVIDDMAKLPSVLEDIWRPS